MVREEPLRDRQEAGKKPVTYRRVIPDRYLAKWAERQADYMAECRRRAWMREHMPDLIDEENDW